MEKGQPGRAVAGLHSMVVLPSETDVRRASALPSRELVQIFERYRDHAIRLREEVVAEAGPVFNLTPPSQAQANLRIARSILGKWSIDILTVLLTVKAARFSELRRSLHGISSDALSRKLRALEIVGLVERRVGPGRPPSVIYSLTNDGLTATRLGEPVFLFLRLRRLSTPHSG